MLAVWSRIFPVRFGVVRSGRGIAVAGPSRPAADGAWRNIGAFLVAAAAAVLSPVPAVAQDVVPPKAYATTPGGINASDGSFVYSSTDLAMGPLVLERYHRGGSRQPNNAMFGTNFSSNFDIYVGRKPAVGGGPTLLIVHIGNSASGQYQQSNTTPSTITDDNADAHKGKLSWGGTTFKYIDSSGTIYQFTAGVIAQGVPFGTGSNSQRILRIDFPDGRRQTFTYTAAKYPRLVEDSSGYAMLFDYNTSNDVIAACIVKRSETYVDASAAYTCAGLGSAALTATYGYTSGRLTSMTDPLGKVTSYVNTSEGVTCVQPPGYTSCTLTQDGGGPSTTETGIYHNYQTLADGGQWKVDVEDGSFLPKGDEGSIPTSNGMTAVTITSPDNQETDLTFTKSSPYTMSDPLGRTTRFKFYGGLTLSTGYGGSEPIYYGSMLVEAEYPEGNKYQADYNGPFRAVSEERHIPKSGSSDPTLTKTYQYTANCEASPSTYNYCAKPILIRDAKNNQTDFTYASHGGVLTEMQPAPSAGAARPLKVTTWALRYAWVKNSLNNLVQVTGANGGGVYGPSGGGIYVKDTETVCETVAGTSPAATCNSSAPQTVTTYEYGANGSGQSLLLKGVAVTSNGVTHRTCYGYDSKDRRIFETQPNGTIGWTSCP